MLEWKSSQSGQLVADNLEFGEVHEPPQSWNNANSGPPAHSAALIRVQRLDNLRRPPRRFALADAVLACKLTPEQYNFSHSELEKGDS